MKVLCLQLLVLSLASFFLTWAMRRYALTRSLLDVPNTRSSHSVATPRGGGIAIVLTFLGAIVWLEFFDQINLSLAIALLGAGGLVALVGFLDDHGHIAARWRLLSHFAAAIWGLYWLEGLPPVTLLGSVLDLGWFGHFLAVVYLVWLLNLYNFMDGIDGIASVEALCVCLGGALIYFLTRSVVGGEVLLLALAASVVGFLLWNFPPARIFMGDAGSGFLGFALGVMSLQAATVDPALLWSWLVLLGVFVVDASFTLLRRLLRGERVYEAHRSHAYQFASRHFGRHLPVTLAVAAINLFWLLPLALLIGLGWLDGVAGLIVAYAPLVTLAVRFRAGALES
ncbi:glycosyltransferase family 4 protein [Ectopseudomonas khazarica]|uniref:glycosyltransferase family 4 protein n=1 Tax=Ectopseudomonas khazarica TaxID=2502979 RepID=UPI0037CB2FAF